MTTRFIRGRLLSFHRAPQTIDDPAAYCYIEDGALLVQEGRIAAIGEAAEITPPLGAEIVDHRPHLILPGLIDAHIHYPQAQVIASYGAQLMDWLNNYTFPEEQKFADPAHAARIAELFLTELLRHGTTTAVVYGPSYKVALDAFFAAANARNMRMLAGKSMMDRNAPPDLCDTAQSSYDDCKALIASWHGVGRAGYVITPRFAITSTAAQLDAAGTLLAEHPDCWAQTHIAENHSEIALTAELFPNAPDYLGVYERHGLLGRRTLLGHCIHLVERERKVMAETGTVAVFCPTSNLFLGSGLFDADGLAAQGVRQGLATDVGGGDSYSMLRTANEAYKIMQLQNQTLNPFDAFYRMTRGNAEILGLEAEIGDLAVGSAADLVVLDSAATPSMALRKETVETLAEELFLLQILGDDRAVAAVYVAGEAAKAA
ncbi:MAG: guanine deaminase [Neomegalonema sp.]|nr:guanine deaminase [Neomegalonema sp.]